MKKVIWFWNLIHYNIFKWEIFTQKIFNYPVHIILNNKKVKEAYKKRGVNNPSKIVLKATNGKKNSINVLFANIHMGGLLVLFEFSLFNLFQAMFNPRILKGILENETLIIGFLIFLIAPAITFNYFALFKKEKYLDYFKVFKKMSKSDSRIYSWISIGFVLFILSTFILSFVFLIYKL